MKQHTQYDTVAGDATECATISFADNVTVVIAAYLCTEIVISIHKWLSFSLHLSDHKIKALFIMNKNPDCR